MREYKFDFSSKTKPYPHQTEAIEFIKGKKYVPLFDEQGLGKTKIVIDSLCYDIGNKKLDGALIICKKSLLSTWEDEIKKHSHLTSTTLRGNSKREKSYKFLSFSHFYIINYAALLSEISRLKMFLKIKNLAIILDESHKIKNPLSKTARAIFEIKSYGKKRIIITGTPIANKPEDIWSQFYFLDDGMLLGNNYKEFKDKYCFKKTRELPTENDIEKIKKLKKLVNGVSIRRLKNDVLELPEKRYQNIVVDLRGNQKNLYDKLKETLYLEIKNMDEDYIMDESTNILKKLLRLTQLASNPALIDQGYQEEPIKYLELDKILRDILSRGEKAVIWTSFVENIRILKKRYELYKPLILYGKVPIEKRKKIVYNFQRYDDFKVLIANPSAAREGITLTSANNAVYLDRNFNLTDYLQSQDRIHRISQTQICNILKIIAKDTIDEYIDDILFKKQDIAQFIQGDREKINRNREYLTKEEILKILG